MRPITSAAFQVLKIGAVRRGRACPWTCATGFSSGTQRHSASPLRSKTTPAASTRARLRAVRSYGTEFTLAFDRELIPNVVVAALNLTYQPEWTRVIGTGAAEQESTIGAAVGLMAQLRPGFFLGGEARYLRRYEGIGLEEIAGQALFVGPTAYFQLSPRTRLTAAWSTQAWGRAAGSNAALDLVNFERHHARLIFGVNF